MDEWQSAAIALAIGFLIGAERERDGGPAGVRTFALAGLAGAGAALVHPIVLGFAVAGASIIMAASYLRPLLPAPAPSTADTTGTTGNGARRVQLSTASTVALILTVLLGGLTVTHPAVAVGGGVATAVILLAKERLHNVIRDKVTELELRDALKFFVAAFIVLPLMPHASLGPHGVLDPRRMWTFVVAVTALGWLGYVAVRLAGPERGLPAAGLAGGFVSSAATTGAMARTARDPKLFRPAMAAALLATVASLVQLVLITAVADTRVASQLLPAVALGAAVLVGEAVWLLRKPGVPLLGLRLGADDRTGVNSAGADLQPAQRQATRVVAPARLGDANVVIEGGTVTAIDFGDPAPSPVEEPAPRESREPRMLVGRRPFDLVPALLLTAILTLFLIISAVVEQALGPGAATVAVAVAGLADSHAGALTAANLASQSALTTQTAVLATMAAVVANTLVKLILAHAAGGRQASRALAILFVAPAVAMAIGLAVTLSLAG